MDAYLDKEGTEYLLNRIKELSDSNEYRKLVVDLLENLTESVNSLERILTEEKENEEEKPNVSYIQYILKLKGNQTIPAASSKTMTIPCGFDAYEIKTIEAKNLTNNKGFQIEILEDDTSNKVIFKSLLDSEIYSNAGDVCNIDEKNKKSVYLRIINPVNSPIEVSYEIKLLNLFVAKTT